MLARRTFVLGGAITKFIGKGNPAFIHPKHPDFGKVSNPTIEDYIVNVTQYAPCCYVFDANV